MQLRTFVLVSLLSASVPMMASTVYTYTGSNFNFSTVNNQIQNPPGTVAPPYSTNDFVTGSFTLSGNVDNLSFSQVAVGSFSFNDGVQTISNSNGSIFADISTDANGNILLYAIGANNSTIANDFIQIGDLGSPGSFGKFQVSPTNVVSAGTNAFGSFTSAQVTPEPASLALLGTGMLGLIAGLRRRIRRA